MAREHQALHIQGEEYDVARWRLDVERGRHRWLYLSKEEAIERPLTFAERYYLGLMENRSEHDEAKVKTAQQAAEKCLRFLARLQLPSGHWGGDLTGPNIDIPGLVISFYVARIAFHPAEQHELIRYVFSIQNDDGGWGLHIAGESAPYSTVMHYVTLRLLGLSSNEGRMLKAHRQIKILGGILKTPQMGKFWLAVLGLMNWDVVYPMIPDLWLLPEWLPIHPWRLWVYPRVLYASMSYIWSKQWSYPGKEKDSLISELRDELYGSRQTFESIQWTQHRADIAAGTVDNFRGTSWLLAFVYWILSVLYVPWWRSSSIAHQAEQRAYNLVAIDDGNTEYGTIACIAAPMALIVRMVEEGPDSKAVRMHIYRMRDYFWMTGDGMAITVTSGVQSWDLAFILQAVFHTNLSEQAEFQTLVQRAVNFLCDQQMDEVQRMDEVHGLAVSSRSPVTDSGSLSPGISLQNGYRSPRRGAWGFSEKGQGYPVSDCTAEALKAVLMFLDATEASSELALQCPMSIERLRCSVDVLLAYQTPSTGGCSCYERPRGSSLLELLNPSQFFDNLMIGYDYPECTSSCMTALQAFRAYDGHYRRAEIDRFLAKAVEYLFATQREDGSWRGSWGICFTYAACFTLQALASQGLACGNCERVRKACEFLVQKQNSDGGWGEGYLSSVQGEWVHHPKGSQAVQTSWALIALMYAEFPDRRVISRGIALLISRQRANGDLLPEDVDGSHHGSCVMKYPNYRFAFPLQAWAMYAARYDR